MKPSVNAAALRDGPGNIVVNVLDLSVPAVVATSPEFASVTVGTATESSTLVARIGLIQPGSMHREGGAMGVSDLLELRTFSTTGFRVSFQSDAEMGITNPGGFTAPSSWRPGSRKRSWLGRSRCRSWVRLT